MSNIILASASPRRIEMMQEHGYNPQVIPSDVDETLPEDISPADAVMYLAEKKARYVLDLLEKDTNHSGEYIIAADTVVVLDKYILGKPKNRKDAFRMISGISGNSHFVMSGVAILQVGTTFKEVFYDATKVNVRPMTLDEINDYLDTDEPYDKAGAYAIQGIFNKYIDSFEGSFDNVVGFPWEKFEKLMPDDIR